jgi:hypothetical protein
MKRIFISIGVALIILIGGFFALNSYIYNEKQADPEDPAISSFEECIGSGYPSLDSYPEQCETPSGKRFTRNVKEEEIADIISPIVVSGAIVCLPHWNTSGAQTLECAFGFRDDSGEYYFLQDADRNFDDISSVPTGVRVEVFGKFIPGSHEEYQSIGTIEVDGITEL